MINFFIFIIAFPAYWAVCGLLNNAPKCAGIICQETYSLAFYALEYCFPNSTTFLIKSTGKGLSKGNWIAPLEYLDNLIYV